MKKILIIVVALIFILTLILPSVTLAYYHYWWWEWESNSLDMAYYKTDDRYVCSLCAGTSIGRYYRDEYGSLPDDDAMYDSLDVYMDTGTTPGDSPIYVNPIDYGPGFVEMALHYGYDNFSYDHDTSLTRLSHPGDTSSDYWKIVEAIENGWPVALTATKLGKGFSGVPAIRTDEPLPINWPSTTRHWIAIEGYEYHQLNYVYDGQLYIYYYDCRIICTDSYTRANELVLDWNNLVDEVGDDLEAIIIKDEDTENDGYVEGFEWGTDGESLNDWQDSGGEVDWYASTCRSWRRVEIDEDVETRPGSTGTKSALFYRGSSSPYAYYDLFQPSYIQFWVRKDGAANAEFRNGNGSKYIRVRINSAEQLQYYAPDGWHTIPYLTISPYSWYWIGLFPNWEDGNYSIFICNANGQLITYYLGAAMRSGDSYNGRLYFGSWSGSGTFWIDDIWDSLR